MDPRERTDYAPSTVGAPHDHPTADGHRNGTGESPTIGSDSDEPTVEVVDDADNNSY